MNASPYLGFEQLGHNPNFEIALNMTLDQLKFYCTSNEQFRTICTDQEFWLRKLRREYPKTIKYKPNGVTWAQYYVNAELIHQILSSKTILPQKLNIYQIAQGIKNNNIKLINLVYNCKMLVNILMFSTDKANDVYQRAVNYLLLIDSEFNADNIVVRPMRFATTPNPKKSDLLIMRGGLSLELALTMNGLVQNPKNVDNLWNNLQVIHIYDIESYPNGDSVFVKQGA
jgi:hypothetical protein